MIKGIGLRRTGTRRTARHKKGQRTANGRPPPTIKLAASNPPSSASAPDANNPADGANSTPPEKGAVVRARAEFGDPDPAKSMAHPLAAAHPEHDVVICIAGCSRDADRVIYKRKKVAAPAKTEDVKPSALTPASFGNKN